MTPKTDFIGRLTEGALSATEDGSPVVILLLTADAVWVEEANEIEMTIILFTDPPDGCPAASRNLL